jgi:hypothetical protein
LLVLLGAHDIFHVSGVRVKDCVRGREYESVDEINVVSITFQWSAVVSPVMNF